MYRLHSYIRIACYCEFPDLAVLLLKCDIECLFVLCLQWLQFCSKRAMLRRQLRLFILKFGGCRNPLKCTNILRHQIKKSWFFWTLSHCERMSFLPCLFWFVLDVVDSEILPLFRPANTLSTVPLQFNVVCSACTFYVCLNIRTFMKGCPTRLRSTCCWVHSLKLWFSMPNSWSFCCCNFTSHIVLYSTM